MKSMMDGPVGHAPESSVVVLVSATLPAVEPMAMVPVASGVGSGGGAGGVVPAASWIRKNAPGASVIGGSGVATHACVVEAAELYCTAIPVRSIGAAVGLWSSMKSFRYWAPLLPPPP